MTGDQARQALAAGRAQIEMWKQRLLPLAGQDVQVEGRRVSLTPQVVEREEPVRTLMLHVWAQVTMTQTMSNVVTLPPEYVQDEVFRYPPFLVATLPYNSAVNGYTWPQVAQILPAAGVGSTPPGELLAGGLWAGAYVEGTVPNFTVEIEDLQKTAVVTLYLRGRYAEDEGYSSDFNDPDTFDRNFNVGRRTVELLLEGNRASPLPNEERREDVRIGYGGTPINVEPISRGAYPDAALTSVLSITTLSPN